MTADTPRPAGRYEWEQAIRRARLGTVIPARKGKNGKTTKGGISGTLFTGIALGWSSYADPDGTRVRPGDATVAVDLETSIAAVRQVRQALLDLGLMQAVGSRRGGHGIEYRLTLPANLGERVEVLTPDQHRAESNRLRDAARGKPASGLPTGLPELGYPVDYPQTEALVPVGDPVDYPSEPEATALTDGSGWSSGTTETGFGWSSGTSLGSPVDTHTYQRPTTTTTGQEEKTLPSGSDTVGVEDDPADREPQPVEDVPHVAAPEPPKPAAHEATVTHLRPGASRAARRNAKATKPAKLGRQPALIPKTAVRLPEALQIIIDDLKARGWPKVTRDDAEHIRRTVVSQQGDKVTPRYLRGIASGSGFSRYYEDLRKERAAAVNKQILELARTQPECEHGTSAGRTPHPITGDLLCPMCRTGAPARPDDGPTTPAPVAACLDAYRRSHRGPLHADQLVVLTQQATGLAAQGATTEALTELARRAGEAGIALFAAATQGGTRT